MHTDTDTDTGAPRTDTDTGAPRAPRAPRGKADKAADKAAAAAAAADKAAALEAATFQRLETAAAMLASTCTVKGAVAKGPTGAAAAWLAREIGLAVGANVSIMARLPLINDKRPNGVEAWVKAKINDECKAINATALEALEGERAAALEAGNAPKVEQLRIQIATVKEAINDRRFQHTRDARNAFQFAAIGLVEAGLPLEAAAAALETAADTARRTVEQRADKTAQGRQTVKIAAALVKLEDATVKAVSAREGARGEGATAAALETAAARGTLRGLSQNGCVKVRKATVSQDRAAAAIAKAKARAAAAAADMEAAASSTAAAFQTAAAATVK